jgi:hypothetical protein
MTAVLRDRKRLSSALSSLDGPSILKHLCRHEHERQITNDKMEEMKLSIEGDWLTVDEWESDYLRRVGETLNEAAVLFWTIDLAWRRYVGVLETVCRAQRGAELTFRFSPSVVDSRPRNSRTNSRH